MQQLGKSNTIFYHLYPGILITICFVILTPLLLQYHIPPQFSLLVPVAVVAIPLLVFHLYKTKKNENYRSVWEVNGFKNKLPVAKLFLYSIALVVIAFLIWGATQPLNKIINDHLLAWLPEWYTVQSFEGYDKQTTLLTFILNLLLNGLLAPLAEEFYFRGYLLSRMMVWGKWAFVLNAVLFSLYHFWQPYIYLTLVLSLMPLTYVVWKTKDIRVGILTHCMLNIIGTLLSFGMFLK